MSTGQMLRSDNLFNRYNGGSSAIPEVKDNKEGSPKKEVPEHYSVPAVTNFLDTLFTSDDIKCDSDHDEGKETKAAEDPSISCNGIVCDICKERSPNKELKCVSTNCTFKYCHQCRLDLHDNGHEECSHCQAKFIISGDHLQLADRLGMNYQQTMATFYPIPVQEHKSAEMNLNLSLLINSQQDREGKKAELKRLYMVLARHGMSIKYVSLKVLQNKIAKIEREYSNLPQLNALLPIVARVEVLKNELHQSSSQPSYDSDVFEEVDGYVEKIGTRGRKRARVGEQDDADA